MAMPPTRGLNPLYLISGGVVLVLVVIGIGLAAFFGVGPFTPTIPPTPTRLAVAPPTFTPPAPSATPPARTATPTNTSPATNSPVPPTSTPAATSTPANTQTSASAPATSTPTNTPTNTRTNTPANTQTSASAPATSTPTNTPTRTNTSTPTRTNTPVQIGPAWSMTAEEFYNAITRNGSIRCPEIEKVKQSGHVACVDLDEKEIVMKIHPVSGLPYFEITREGDATTTDHEIPWFYMVNPWTSLQFGWLHGERKCGLNEAELATLGYTVRNKGAGIPGMTPSIPVEGLSFYASLAENLGRLPNQTWQQRGC